MGVKHLRGIEVVNDLSESVSNVQIISVISKKSNGFGDHCFGWLGSGLVYSTDWRTVDVENTNSYAGNWSHRQLIDGYAFTTLPTGHNQVYATRIRFNPDCRHYWMFKCHIGGRLYTIDKKNAMCNLGINDAGSIVRFTLRFRNPDGSIRLNVTLNSGTAYFALIQV